ncbi:CAP domain-containing protein [Micromonospora sp. NPDC049679]|uniref:CAP domain-containing protein n=1 Tax=Micromonospora sp. NPDC049679 TaxID=3155920 RepID=UPI0033D50557
MFTALRRVVLLATVPAVLLGVALTGSPASAALTSTTTLEAQVVKLTNAARAKSGCKAVRSDSRLVKAARAHTADMIRKNFFSHTGSDGSRFTTRATRAGYKYALSENIAWGYKNADHVVAALMKSPGHRRNILNCSAKAVGVGVARKANGTLMWTQDFGRV